MAVEKAHGLVDTPLDVLAAAVVEVKGQHPPQQVLVNKICHIQKFLVDVEMVA